MTDDTDDDATDRLDRAKRLRERREGDADDDRSRRIGRRGRRERGDTPEDAEADTPEDEADGEDERTDDAAASGFEFDAAPEGAGGDADDGITVEVTVPDSEGSAAETAGDGTATAAVEPRQERSGDDEEDETGPETAADDEGETDSEVPVAPVTDVDAADGEPEVESDEGETEADADSADESAASDSDAESETVRVLEFRLGGERYVVAIDYVEEILAYDGATRVPNSPAEVAGVVDIRGQITTLLDPAELLDVATDPAYVVVLDGDQFEDAGAYALLVDDVSEVGSIERGAVADAPGEEAAIEAVVRDDDGFRIWLEPDVWTGA